MSTFEPHTGIVKFARGIAGPHSGLSQLLGAGAVAVLLGLLLSLSGCASGSSGLPQNFAFPPAAGFGISSAALPDGVAGRSYTYYVRLHGGTAPFNCQATLPAGLSIASAPTVPSGPLAGTNACVITGTPAAGDAGTTTMVTINVSDSSSPAQVARAVTLNLYIRQEFTITAPPLATNQGVAGRTYGVAPQSSTATTTVSATVGNAPLTACALGETTAPDSFTLTVISPGLTSCAFMSTAALVGGGDTYTLTFTATDSPIVDLVTGLTVVFPAGTNGNPVVTTGVTPLTVNRALTIATGLIGAPNGPMDDWTINAATPYDNAMPARRTVVATAGTGLPAAETTYSCSSTGFPAGLNGPPALTSGTPPTCVISGTPTALATNAAVSVFISDTGNSAVPGASPSSPPPAGASSTSTSTITINPQPTITVLTSPAYDGVTNNDASGAADNRPYSATITASGGTGTLGLTSASLNAGNCVGLSVITVAAAAPTLPLGAAPNVMGTTNGNPSVTVTYPATATCSFTVTATDSTGTTNPIANQSESIIIHAPVRIMSSVNGTALTPATQATQAAAVTGRVYGTGGANPLVITATGGLAPVTISISSGTPPNPIMCPASAPGATPTLTCSSANPVTGATAAIMANAKDSTDTAVVASDSVTTSETITVLPALSFMPTMLMPTGPPMSTLPNAVNGRPYGQAGGTPLTFNVSGGTGTPTLAAAGTFPANGFCTYAAPTLTCSTANVTAAAGTVSTFTVTATDTGDLTVPAATTLATGATSTDTLGDTSYSIATNAKLSFRPTMLMPTGPPMSTLPTAVNGRSYAQAPQTPLLFVVSGGATSDTLTAAGTFPAAMFCSYADPTLTCGTANVTAAAGSVSTFTVTATDGGSTAVPAATNAATGATSTDTLGDTSYSITTNGPLTLTVDPAGVNPPTPGVINRTYGNTMAGFKALVYDAGGGIPGAAGYSFNLPGETNAPGINGTPMPVGCAANGANTKVTCSGGTSPVAPDTTGTYPFQIVVNDAGNAATPSGSSSGTTATFSTSITIRSQLVITVSPNPVTNAVTGRGYGVAAGGSQDLTYSVAAGEGLPTVTIMGAGFPAPITCTTMMNAADSTLTMPCNSGGAGVTGATATGTVTVTDTANATTPAATTTSDPGSQRTDQITVVPELTIGNTFLENGTVGEPYSAIFYSNNGGIPSSTAPVPPAYTWSTTAGGLAGVAFINPSPLPTDDPTQQRGYYVGTPTTASTPTVSTTFTVTDSSNPTTPSCSTAGTCPTFTTTNKVLPEDGFVATYASGAGEQGDTVVSFDSNAFSAINFISLNTDAAFDANPVVARVSPDGEWVYVPKQGNTHDVSVIDSISTVTGCTPAATCATNDLAVQSIVVSNTATFNPSAIDIENQKFFSAPFACGTAPCSVQRNFRYDAWLVDPTDGNQTAAIVEPIPDAENPGTVTTPLTGTNTVTVADADNIAISPDTTLAFVSVNYLPSGTACGALPTDCATLTPLNLPATPITASPTTGTTQNTFGLRAGAVAADPRGNNVYTATRSQDATTAYITVTTSSATPSFVAYIPAGAGTTTSGTSVCSASGTTFTPVAAIPTAVTVSPDGNRLFLSCLDTATPQVNNTVGVWNISDTGAGISFVQSIALPASSGSATNSENGCTTPVDVKAKLTTSTTYGTRLFVSCQDSDTIVPIDYNTGSGSTAVDSNAVDSTVSTDGTAITNASIGNTTPAYTNYACGNTGSCPQLLDLMPNPPIHFTSGGYVPTFPVALPKATMGQPYSGFVVVAGGTVVDSTGTVKRTWSNPDGVLASDPNCAGLTLNINTGEISGTSTGTSGTTCGGAAGFTIRVTDASVLAGVTPAGQFVERTFTIAIH